MARRLTGVGRLLKAAPLFFAFENTYTGRWNSRRLLSLGSSHQKNEGEYSHHIQLSDLLPPAAVDVRSCMAPVTIDSRKPAKSNPLMKSSFYGNRWCRTAMLKLHSLCPRHCTLPQVSRSARAAESHRTIPPILPIIGPPARSGVYAGDIAGPETSEGMPLLRHQRRAEWDCGMEDGEFAVGLILPVVRL